MKDFDYSYFVVELSQNGKHYAYSERVANCNNLLAYFSKDIANGVSSITAFKTWKQAKETAQYWNDCYRNNNTLIKW